MEINLTPIIQAIIALLAALVTYRLIPWIKAKTTYEQQSNLQALIKVLVFAAEQIYGAGNGSEKLEYVCHELHERGYNVDLSQIEAAVYDAFNFDSVILRPNRVNDKAENDADQDKGAENVDDTGALTGRVADAPPTDAADGRWE